MTRYVKLILGHYNSCINSFLMNSTRHPLSGDLIFADLPDRELNEAIIEASLIQCGADSPKFSHAAIIHVVKDEPFAVEALSDAVVVTRLEDFIIRPHSEPATLLRPEFDAQIRFKAGEIAFSMKGLPYDDRFSWDGKAMYCAKLIARAFVTAGAPEHLFAPVPMHFGDPGSALWKKWKKYFDDLGAEIPEGMPGLNPLALYMRLKNHNEKHWKNNRT
jgi:hypothetical protein